MSLESLIRASKICTIIMGICFIGATFMSVLGLVNHAITPLFAIIVIVFTGGTFGHAIYMDIKNGRWNDGFKL